MLFPGSWHLNGVGEDSENKTIPPVSPTQKGPLVIWTNEKHHLQHPGHNAKNFTYGPQMVGINLHVYTTLSAYIAADRAIRWQKFTKWDVTWSIFSLAMLGSALMKIWGRDMCCQEQLVANLPPRYLKRCCVQIFHSGEIAPGGCDFLLCKWQIMLSINDKSAYC